MTTLDSELLAKLRGILDEESRYVITSDDAIVRMHNLLADYEDAVRRGGWGVLGRDLS